MVYSFICFDFKSTDTDTPALKVPAFRYIGDAFDAAKKAANSKAEELKNDGFQVESIDEDKENHIITVHYQVEDGDDYSITFCVIEVDVREAYDEAVLCAAEEDV